MTSDEIKEILEYHRKWLRDEQDGKRANLSGANLSGANLIDANLPSPTMVLLANWGDVPDDLTIALMRYDAECHPIGAKAFKNWVDTGECPYSSCSVQRAANFTEKKGLWSPGPPKRPFTLMAMVLDEKCPGWRDEKNDKKESE